MSERASAGGERESAGGERAIAGGGASERRRRASERRVVIQSRAVIQRIGRDHQTDDQINCLSRVRLSGRLLPRLEGGCGYRMRRYVREKAIRRSIVYYPS